MNGITEERTSKTVAVTEGPLSNFKIHYNDVGSGDAVVMMHGSGPGASSWSNFSRNIEPLVEAGFRVLLIDSPGWSKSDPIVVTEGPRTPINAAAVKGVLDALNVQTAHLIGNSMGGAAAIQFAVSYPDRIGKLVTMGGGGGGPSMFVPLPTEGIKLLLGLYSNPTMESLKQMLNVFVFDPSRLTDDLVRARYENMMNRKDHLDNFVASSKSNPRHLMSDLSPYFPQIKAKTLITWGRDDRFVPLDGGLRLLWSLRDARMHIFSRCGHWAQWEHADDFNRLVVDFLKN
jgi:2-hydroxy-6-oxonona-2,4-dienedioate hydrolase